MLPLLQNVTMIVRLRNGMHGWLMLWGLVRRVGIARAWCIMMNWWGLQEGIQNFWDLLRRRLQSE